MTGRNTCVYNVRAMTGETGTKKFSILSQTDFPRVTLKESLVIAKALVDNFAAKSATPLDIAGAINRSPTSSDWRYLTGASVAYGLTTGGYNAKEVGLTDLGRKIIMPTEENQDKQALIKAALNPRILKSFYEKYDRNKFPREDIAINVLVGMGVPSERAKEALGILKENGNFVGILANITGNLFVQLSKTDAVGTQQPTTAPETLLEQEPQEQEESTTPIVSEPPAASQTLKVFISHGKNSKILDQIKTSLELGGFEPVVAEEEETTAIPVPKKILDQMRECQAAVISVSADKSPEEETKTSFEINQNVLIEIGTAFVLYDERVILVWDKRVKIPSNLQGLYRCEYEGDELSWEAGMKLQKALVSIKKGEKPVGEK